MVYRRALLGGGLIAVVLVALGAVVLTRRGDEAPVSRDSRQEYQAFVRRSLFALLQPVHLSNCTLERFGEAHDGGYLVCANLLGDVQAGYSYGISGYDQFGCDLSRRRTVPVHEYDCFDTRQPACPGGELVFHAECVGTSEDVEDGRRFDSMAGQIRRNGDSGKHLLIKIDVEGAEWNSFLLSPDSVFERTDQLVVEFHGVDDDRYVQAVRRLKQFFHVVHVHYNNYSCDPALAPFPAGAYEVLFVNRRLAMVDSSAPPGTAPHPLDAPNKPDGPDCQQPLADR